MVSQPDDDDEEEGRKKESLRLSRLCRPQKALGKNEIFSFGCTAFAQTLGSNVFYLCSGLNKNGPKKMFGHQGAVLFERIGRIRRCGPVEVAMEGNESLGLGFVVSKAHHRPRHSLFAYRSRCSSQVLF